MLLAILLAAWTPPTRVETGLLIVAEALIAVDGLQTLDIKRHPFMYETNPLLGKHPSDAVIGAVTIGSMLAVALAFYVLPTPWRDAVTLPVLFVEVPNTLHNAWIGMAIRL